MRVQPLIYNFEYQRKGNTRKSIKGRFAQSDTIKKYYANKKLLDNSIKKKQPIDIYKIQDVVCSYYNVPKNLIFSKGKKELSNNKTRKAKNVFLYLCRNMLEAKVYSPKHGHTYYSKINDKVYSSKHIYGHELSYTKIGKLLNCDHTSVLYSHKKIEKLITEDKSLKLDIKYIKNLINKKPKKEKKDILHAIKNIKDEINSKDYVMPIYKNNFIKIKSFIPRNSNRIKYKIKTRSRKIFDSKYSAEKHARTLEQEHIEHVKQQYEDYYSTNKYN